jgi:hypothetical protein
MDTTLVTVTLLSMAMAITLSVIVWRMLRDERQRSAARVLALTQLARPVARDLPLRTSGSGLQNARIEGSVPGLENGRIRHEIADSANRPGTRFGLFSDLTPVLGSPWGARFVVMTGLALIVAAAVLFALAAQARRTAAPATATGKAGVATAVTPALELLSLRDAHEGSTLSITGLVHNPKDGTPLSRVAVTAFAFDEKGAFLASGRALLDVTSLAPGDDSSFVVTVPVTDGVARYRISFRSDDGRVVAHVDKRQPGPVAANW